MISRVVGEKANSQNDGNEQKDDAPYFLTDRGRGLFGIGFVFFILDQIRFTSFS